MRLLPGSQRRILEPIERISEVLFGLIMVLTFTSSLSAAQAGRSEIRTMLFGALGCNLAWGLIDGIMYLMACLSGRAEELRLRRALRSAADATSTGRLLEKVLPAEVSSALQTDDLERIRRTVRDQAEPEKYPRWTRDDWLGAFAVFCWVFVSTFPVVLPFVLMDEPRRALRMSNGIAIAMLFLTGWSFAHCAGLRPWRTGVAMVFLGLGLVAITVALGG